MAVRSLFFYCSLPLLVFGALNSGDITAKKFLIQACPQGWVAYQECCYLFENRTMSLPMAEKRCSLSGSTLFVANSDKEFHFVSRLTARNLLSWIGLAQFEQQDTPVWQTTSGIDPIKMKWLVNPFSASGNGWSAASKCVAYLNSDAESARYLYFYPCDSLFQSVCERNLTFNSALARQAGSL